MPRHAVLLFVDATTLRWFPPLRFAWGFRGEQVVVKITGRNAKRVLFGAINPRTGHRLVFRRPRQRPEDFQAFLRHLRRRYPGRPSGAARRPRSSRWPGQQTSTSSAPTQTESP